MTDENTNLRRTAFLVSSFFFLHYATLGIIFPYTGYFFRQAGFTGTEIGVFLSIFPMVKFLLTDKWLVLFSKVKNKNLFMAFCLGFSTLCLIPLAFSTNRLLVGVMLFLFAVTRTGAIPVIDSIAISLDEKIPYGRLRLFGSIGFICTSILGGFLMDRVGMNSFIWSFTLTGLLSIIPALVVDYSGEFLKPTDKSERKITPEMGIFFAGITIYLTTFGFLSNFFNIRVAEAGFSQSWAGNMWSIGVVAEVIFLYNQERILKLFNVKLLISFSILMAGIRYLITGYSDSLLVLCLASTLNGFAYGGFHLGAMRYIRTYVPQKLRLKAQGMYSGFGYGLGTILGSFASGLIYDMSGVSTVFFTAFCLCIVAAGVLYLFTGRAKPAEAA